MGRYTKMPLLWICFAMLAPVACAPSDPNGFRPKPLGADQRIAAQQSQTKPLVNGNSNTSGNTTPTSTGGTSSNTTTPGSKPAPETVTTGPGATTPRAAQGNGTTTPQVSNIDSLQFPQAATLNSRDALLNQYKIEARNAKIVVAQVLQGISIVVKDQQVHITSVLTDPGSELKDAYIENADFFLRQDAAANTFTTTELQLVNYRVALAEMVKTGGNPSDDAKVDDHNVDFKAFCADDKCEMIVLKFRYQKQPDTESAADVLAFKIDSQSGVGKLSNSFSTNAYKEYTEALKDASDALTPPPAGNGEAGAPPAGTPPPGTPAPGAAAAPQDNGPADAPPAGTPAPPGTPAPAGTPPPAGTPAPAGTPPPAGAPAPAAAAPGHSGDDMLTNSARGNSPGTRLTRTSAPVAPPARPASPTPAAAPAPAPAGAPAAAPADKKAAANGTTTPAPLTDAQKAWSQLSDEAQSLWGSIKSYLPTF